MRQTSLRKGLLGLLVLGTCAGAATAQSVRTLIKEGDTIVGMGALTVVGPVLVNDGGMWIDVADTDYPDSDFDGCVLRDGFITLREGTTLFSPSGAILDDWDSTWLNNHGDLAMALKLDLPGISGVKEGLFWNTVPIAIQDSVINSPALGPNSIWVGFDSVKINDSRQIFTIGDIDNKAVTGTKEKALIRYEVDAEGNVLSTTVLGTKGQNVPALGTNISTLQNTEAGLAVNKHGDFITVVQGVGAQNATMINLTTIVAQEGFPSPIPGINWKQLINLPKVSINDFGDYIFTGALDTANAYLIVKNGQKFAQQGDILPKYSTLPLSNGSAAPIYVANNGDVFWRAKTTSAVEDAFMRNDAPIIQMNKTVVDGSLVTKVEIADNAFAVSPNGRFFVGRCELQSSSQPKVCLLFMDFGLVVKIPGCLGNTGKLSLISGQAMPGKHLLLGMDAGQAPGVTPTILFSTAPRLPNSDCGVATQYGELLVRTSSKVALVFLPTWDGANPSTIDLNIPNDLSLVDSVFFAQGIFRGGNPAIALTNGLRIEFGAP